jgi:hypothetical protein
MTTLFLRALDAADKETVLRELCAIPTGTDTRRFEVNTRDFSAIPRSPFAYWATPRMRSLFASLEPFEASGRAARVGVATLDNFRFLRAAWEVPNKHGNWVPYAKGGAYSPFYSDVHLLVAWADSGREVKRYVEQVVGSVSRKIQAADFYFRPGITWPSRTQRGFAPRALPRGCIFDTKGNSAFVPEDEGDAILSVLAIFLSRAFKSLVDLQMAFGSYEVGVVQRTPLPRQWQARGQKLAKLAFDGWQLKRSLDTCVQVSHAFMLPALLQAEGESLAARGDAWAARVRAVEAKLDAIHSEIDERCFDLYGIDDTDGRAISEGLSGDSGGFDAQDSAREADEADDGQDVGAAADAVGLTAELVSWAVGVAFGRFDVRLATGERKLPREPGPFDPLPVCPPGMLVGEDELPVAGLPPRYPLDFPRDGILVDDPGDARDLTAAVRAVFDLVFGSNADAMWDEAAASLDRRGRDLRAWLRSGLFEWHLKQHSMSRRRAPILWQLGTPSGRYSIWLYAHLLTDDSLFQVQNDVLAPKLAYEERQLTNLVQSSGGSPSANDRREIEAQERFVEELHALLGEAKVVAPLWRPTLDDGIVLAMSPLWCVVPLKPWQRELKRNWGELVAGKYDWAELAMHLWPERVIPKCRDDRSLAIAHGLEDVFWVEDEDGKWQPRQEPTAGVNDLIRERTSAAVKDALGALA